MSDLDDLKAGVVRARVRHLRAIAYGASPTLVERRRLDVDDLLDELADRVSESASQQQGAATLTG